MNRAIKKVYPLLMLLLLGSPYVLAQTQFKPKKADEAINTEYPELNPVLSPDGNELYFVRANHPDNSFGDRDSEDIWYSKRDKEGHWSQAVHVPELNIARYNAVWAVTDNGKSLLLHGQFNKKGNLWKKRGFSLVTRAADGKWGKPVPVKVAKFSKRNNGRYTTAYMTPDGQHLLMSFSKKHNSRKSILYISHRKNSGKFSKPKKMNVQKGATQVAPFVTADGKQLFFASNKSGNFDVWTAERQDEKWKKWSDAKPYQTQVVNTKEWESYFRTNATASMAWYAARETAKTNPDLYFVKLYEENPFVAVTGRVVNKNNGNQITDLPGFYIYVNDTLYKNLAVADDGSFEIKLPLGKNYQLKPHLQHHDAHVTTIKADSLVEYTETTADLYLSPWKVVQVKGKVMEAGTQDLLPVGAKAQVLVNGQMPDSLQFNASTGEYMLWLPFGKHYQLQVQAAGYKPASFPLALEKVNSYREIDKNLYVEKISTALVQGRLLDSKTKQKFPAGVPVQVVLNDTLQLAVIDSVGTYEVKLPLGKVHTLSAKAEGYYPITEMIDLQKETATVKVYKDLFLAPVEVGQSIRLNNVFFETGKATLMPASFPELDRVVEFLKDNGNMKIEIAGHTDNKGSASLNTKLSAARADAVAKYIIDKGISKDQLSAKGYGSSKPEADNKTEEGRSKNRRVEFTILEMK